MTLVRLPSLFAAAALALVVTATASGALTPSDYRAQANAACAKANTQRKALNGQSNGMQTTAEILAWVARGLVVTRREYASLNALQPPASLGAAHRRALGFQAQEIAIVANEVKQMQAGTDWTKVLGPAAQVALPLVMRESGAWAAAGVAVCSSGGFSISG